MTDRAEQILDVAQDLIQTRGYSAMSFQDIAERVGIRKPSIVHHFPTKHALGAAVIERYRTGYDGLMDQALSNTDNSAWDALDTFLIPYLEFAEAEDKVCLCGALSGEAMVLPAEMREELRRFFDASRIWMERILKRGNENGTFYLADTPQDLARVYLSTLQGALLVKRATGDAVHFATVVRSLKTCLRP